MLRSRLLTEDGESASRRPSRSGGCDEDARPHHDGVPRIQLPPLEECVRLSVDAPGFTVPLMGVLDEHLDPACLGWATGSPSGKGELRGYLAFGDGRPFDPLALLLAVDALPPATFDVGLTGWVPTMQLSAWVRALPGARAAGRAPAGAARGGRARSTRPATCGTPAAAWSRRATSWPRSACRAADASHTGREARVKPGYG